MAATSVWSRLATWWRNCASVFGSEEETWDALIVVLPTSTTFLSSSVIKGLPKNKSFQKNKRQVFSRMIIILRGGEKRVAEGNPFLPLSPSSMHEESIHLSSTLKLNSVKLVCFVAK
ncbi:L-lactate dehydrogenase [Nostoc sphaeroides CCNUC1]|uniref:L-lactate dehydrogenase n=1 Tax=Nostoc sphaeroides CCNUC1 TaxID=2653204 RepID=A0A5P8WL23_9NOSO|nr:L-lactate dehydrogenase [Nostoc sphaeroides CCNUC1]